jgi:NhaP-type Na+/H+ or K+/H+ antiporter
MFLVSGFADLFEQCTCSLFLHINLVSSAFSSLLLQVFTCALELPQGYIKRNLGTLLLLVGPLMLASWGITFLLTYAIMGFRYCF